MTTARSVFISSAVFGVVIAIVYYISSRHEGGTLLLGLMAFAMIFAAGFMFVVQREANLSGDDKNAGTGIRPREDIGVFTTETIWPVAAAVSTCVLLVGVLWSPYVAAGGFVALVYSLWRLSLESNRN